MHIINESVSSLRKDARTALKDKWLGAFWVFLCYYAVVAFITFILVEYVPGDMYSAILGGNFSIPFVAWVYMIVILGPMNQGLTYFLIKLVRRNKLRFGLIFDGFGRMLKCVGLEIAKLLLVLWPMIIVLVLGTAYILVFVTSSNTKQFLVYSSAWFVILMLAFFVAFIGSVIYMVFNALKYSQAFFILSDDKSKSISTCLLESGNMMIGNKGKLFMLVVSFIGWIALAHIPLAAYIAFSKVLSSGTQVTDFDPTTMIMLMIMSLPIIIASEYIFTALGEFYVKIHRIHKESNNGEDNMTAS